MPNLISPDVLVTIQDESIYSNGAQTTIPLFFITTEEEKLRPDGVNPALGTYESGVLRTVTSKKQALELYGVPKYYYSADGQPHYGDCRNEYGLDALFKYLDVGNRAYVIRANVNTNDEYVNVKNMWSKNIDSASNYLKDLVTEFINEYNATNHLTPADPGYKTTIDKTDLKTLVDVALEDVFKKYSFSSEEFIIDFTRDHTLSYAGYQDIVFDTTGGFITASDITGLQPAKSYSAQIQVTSTSGTNVYTISVLGSQVVTFGQLLTELNTAFSGEATASIVSGRIRIISNLVGATSSVSIVADGSPTTDPLFSSLNFYKTKQQPIHGRGPMSLVVYDNSFVGVVGSYDGLYKMIDDFVGTVVPTELSPTEAKNLLKTAADMFDNTNEFRLYTSLGINDAAKRAKIVKAVIDEIKNVNNGSRDGGLEFDVVLAPGFYEASGELVSFTQELRGEVFVIGETPFDKPLTGVNSIVTWSLSSNKTASSDIAYVYPHGLSRNLDGNEILTTSSAILLRLMAKSALNNEIWVAPAGLRRGVCDFLEDVGYVSGELGTPTTFVSLAIDDGGKGLLYEDPKNVNPLVKIPGSGIVLMGQKTSQNFSSALDRINVSRLVKYIKREVRKLSYPYLFEPIDDTTFREVRNDVSSFLSGILAKNGIYDFFVKVDNTNNTPDTIDRNELWIDVAIKPVKAVEFIYIPIRVLNTGDQFER